ncbi:hypothetical protein ACFWFR_18455 [Oerskovia sp. NPDC060287]|uniref:hypothetical protein n=1 Tax=Oerskovia sp. NPDC060287 TaxID=3347095 RepID=UPI00364B2A83
MSAAAPDTAGHADEPLPVAPVLVRDYRRLVRLFPFTYRREHGAEMLGHLLDGARPGQSRPTSAERRDLLRAAAREWLLAPLGATARERRAATGLLFVLLPAVLVIPAARAIAYASLLLGGGAVVGDEDTLLAYTLSSVPTVAMWVIWCAGIVALLGGLARTGRVLVGAAAVAGIATVSALVMAGSEHTAYLELGWVLGLVAHVVVVAEHARCRTPGHGWRRAVGTAWCMALALGGYVTVMSGDMRFGTPWWSSAGPSTLGDATVALAVAVVLGAGALWSRTRQSVPVLLGVAVGVGLGRSDIFWSGNRNIGTEDLGNILALLACSLAAMIAARWFANRLDELAGARAAHHELLGATTGVFGARGDLTAS